MSVSSLFKINKTVMEDRIYKKSSGDVTYVLKGGLEKFDDCYDILKNLGKGAFGQVYEAFDLKNGERIAVKVLQDKTLDNQKRPERQYHETQTGGLNLEVAETPSHRPIQACRTALRLV